MKRKHFQLFGIILGYALSVLLAEMTFGNPNFPLTLWVFKTISPWQWSLPVHAAGLLWLLGCHHWFRTKPTIAPVICSLLFFLGAESANWFVFDFFAYTDGPMGRIGSFGAVILLYGILCTGCVWLLRRKNG